MDDIFRGDRRVESEDSFSDALGNIGKGLKKILFKKFYMNVIIMILIIATAVIITLTIQPKPMTICPNISCPQCPVQQQCALQSCDDCSEKILTEYIYRFICSNGAIVNTSDGCVGQPPITDPAYTSTTNGISITFDGISYQVGANNTMKVTQINYTIVNNGNNEIVPKVGLKIYELYTDEVKNAYYLRVFKADDVLGFSEWIKKSEAVNIDVQGAKLTVRLDLINTITDPDEYITTVTREISSS